MFCVCNRVELHHNGMIALCAQNWRTILVRNGKQVIDWVKIEKMIECDSKI